MVKSYLHYYDATQTDQTGSCTLVRSDYKVITILVINNRFEGWKTIKVTTKKGLNWTCRMNIYILIDQIRYIYLEYCIVFHKLSMESKITKIGASSQKL